MKNRPLVALMPLRFNTHSPLARSITGAVGKWSVVVFFSGRNFLLIGYTKLAMPSNWQKPLASSSGWWLLNERVVTSSLFRCSCVHVRDIYIYVDISTRVLLVSVSPTCIKKGWVGWEERSENLEWYDLSKICFIPRLHAYKAGNVVKIELLLSEYYPMFILFHQALGEIDLDEKMSIRFLQTWDLCFTRVIVSWMLQSMIIKLESLTSYIFVCVQN